MLSNFFRSRSGPIPAGIDWDQIITAAYREDLLPALADQCRKLGIAAHLTPEFANVLNTAETQNAQRNETILAEAAHVATLLNQIGIQPVALKGLAYLLAGVYPNPATRYLLDIDLLLPKTDIPRAVAHLKQNGYFENESANLLQFRHHHPSIRRAGNVNIELHHRVGQGICHRLLPTPTLLRDATVHSGGIDLGAGGIGLQACRLTSTSSPSSAGGIGLQACRLTSTSSQLMIPTPTNLINHLILHSQLAHPYDYRIFPPLRALVDLVHLQNHFTDQIDWPALAKTYRENGEYATLALHLKHANSLLGMEIPKLSGPPLTYTLALRWKRRQLLNRYPALRFIDPIYILMSLFSRRLRLLPQILRHPRSWPQVLRTLTSPSFYRNLFAV